MSGGAPALAFGVVGPGAIADVFAAAVTEAGVGRVARVLGRTPARAQAFAARHGARAVDGLDALLERRGADAVDAVYVATPHAFHADVVRAALAARVPVLCEKPLTTHATETAALHALAARAGVPLMEAWMYRAHPQVHALFTRVAEGLVGTVRRVEAEFAFSAPYDPDHRLYAPRLGGGAVLDVGGYPLSFALGVARAARGVLPEVCWEAAEGQLAPSGVEAEATARLALAGFVADLRVSIQDRALGEGVRSRARVVGDRGALALEEPWCPEGRRRGREGVLVVERDGTTERVALASEHDCFALEAAAFARLVAGRAADPDAPLGPAWPLVDAAESVALAELADAWRERVRAVAVQSY